MLVRFSPAFLIAAHLLVAARLCPVAEAAELSAPPRIGVTTSHSQIRLSLPLLPHLASIEWESSTNLAEGFTSKGSDGSPGGNLIDQALNPAEFFRARLAPLSSNDLLSAIVLNRLAYGPTPDEIERVRAMGPQAYLEEQLAPEKIFERPELEESKALQDGWEYVTLTGRATSSELWLMLWDGGPAYIDDLVLVKGPVPEQGENLVRNGDFEALLRPEDWELGGEFRRSQTVSSPVYRGRGALGIMAEYSSERRNLIRQLIKPGLIPHETYTVSFWYYRFANHPNQFSLMLAGSHAGYGLFGSPDDAVPLNTKVRSGLALPEELRAWHVNRAVSARRQLLEVLVQFLENHFTSAITKSRAFFGNVYDSGAMIYRAATEVESDELERWRAALLNPDCTFHDLLKICVESPAMIIYLDTLYSVGGPGFVPNENFARELMELFTMGSDNGYDQEDVTAMARVWTGWRLNIVDPGSDHDPFAPRATRRVIGFDEEALRSFIGEWRFSFESRWHDSGEKVLFRDKTIPARFGAKQAGKSYELRLPARTGRDGIQDGYDAIRHLADLPFTQEFISVKLCQLFVHDDFSVGYDFTAPELSPEGHLVRACIEAWEGANPKGNIRQVLRVIFDSELFRSQHAAFQKIKTPLEFTVSAIRALRSEGPGLPPTAIAGSGGFDLALERMGRMIIFEHQTPDGIPESSVPLINASTIVERIRFVQAYLSPAGAGRPPDAGTSWSDPVALLRRKLPQAKWTDVEAVVDYFLETIYFGHGKASLQPMRDLARRFLQNENGDPAAPEFNLLIPGTTVYEERVRGLAALLMSLAAFSQQ